ncbi:MAG TPA: hypothetical protein PLA94_01310 [Myxococcota bacterium]|nr:hypothetical protein [Myxococcota bacterium]
MNCPIYLEIHVDEWLLRQEPARWDQAAALLHGLCHRAEQAGARLSLRVRESFVEGDSSAFLMGLVRRGHEVGWHSHGEDASGLVAALQQRGLPTEVATPGLVQAGRNGRRLLEQAQKLGVRRITDSQEQRSFVYQGWLAWQPLPGLWSLDGSVSPFAWGVLERGVLGVRHRHGGLDWARLRRLAESWGRWPVPRGYAGYFGATFHEHNLCPPESYSPLQGELDGFQRFLDHFGSQIQTSGSIPLPEPPSPPVEQAVGRLPLLLQRLRRGAKRLREPALQQLVVGQRQIPYRVWGEPRRGNVVVVHGGISGLEQRLGFLGLSPDDLAADGIAVWCFARTAQSFLTPGNPLHRAELRALVDRALATSKNTGILSWSGGLIPALGVASERPLRFLVDAEGPVDRYSLVPLHNPPEELRNRSIEEDALWIGLEALPPLAQLRIPYLRLQGSVDHAHEKMSIHAHRAVQAVPDGRLGWLPGRLHEHPEQLRRLLGSLFP